MSQLLETIGISSLMGIWTLAIFGPMFWTYLLIYTQYWHVAVGYLIWLVYDRDVGIQGGRRFNFVRKLPIWKSLCNYFPMKIVKTAELDPSKNYLIGYHPHGMYSTGLHSNFAMEGNSVSETFPGIKVHFLTLNFNFWIPIFRDCVLAAGGCSVSRESMNFLLSKRGGGNAAFIVPGGAREALYCHPGTEEIYLKKRKGFIKVAIQNGSPLVPIYSFGESDIYSQPKNPPGSLLRRMQEKIIDAFGAVPILVTGNGVLPRRYPITSVVGAPISVQKMTDPSQDYIDKIHATYVEALSALYYKHRKQYGHDNVDLIIH